MANVLLIKGNVDSEWDNCDVVAVELTESFLKDLAVRYEALKPLIGLQGFYEISFFDNRGRFLCFNDSDEDAEKEIQYLQTFFDMGYGTNRGIEMDEYKSLLKCSGLDTPEQTVDVITMELNNQGQMKFRGLGKQSSEQFWSENISIEEVLKLGKENHETII